MKPVRQAVASTSVAALVAVAVLFGVGRPAAAVAGFGDVPDGQYYTAAVQWMVGEGITNGTSPACFSPDGATTRGEAAAFLHRMRREPAAPPHPFTDVVAPWQQAAVAWLHSAGITTGTSPTTFEPALVMTRGQMAVMLHRLAGAPAAPPHPFTDVVAPWQRAAVAWLHSAGVTTGTSATTFSPELPVTRAQFATFLHRYAGTPAVEVDASEPVCVDGPVRQVTATGYGVVASAGPVELRFPAATSELVGYHESGHDGARALTSGPHEVRTVTMESRDRGTHPRSAVDVAVAPDTEIRSPVTGTVIRAGGYTLYCDHRDEFVVIEPDARPGWEVKMFHFDGLAVVAGSRVEAGITVVGTSAAVLPFSSQIDELTASPSWPHVHLEVVDPSIPDRPSSGGC